MLFRSGRFVKKASKSVDSNWIECGEDFVREKVTQSLRDGLSFKYSSSTSRKRERKARAHLDEDWNLNRIVTSNAAVSRKVRDIAQRAEEANRMSQHSFGGLSEDAIDAIVLTKILNPGNWDILETIKKDQSLLQRFREAQNALDS